MICVFLLAPFKLYLEKQTIFSQRENISLSLHLPSSFASMQPICIWLKLLPSPSAQAVVPFFLHKHKYSLPSYYPHTWEKLYMFLRCPGSYCLLKFIASFGFICNLLAVCCWPQMLCTKHRWPSHNHWLVAELLYFMLVINFLPRISEVSLATRLCSIFVILRIKRFLL